MIKKNFHDGRIRIRYDCIMYSVFLQGDDFDSSQGLLGGTMGRIQHMVSSGKNNRKLMCYIIMFLVAIFIICYYFISRITAG